jgi:hypothetical protein
MNLFRSMGQLLLGPREEPEQVQTRRVPDAAAVATAITELAERLHDDERERENIMPLLQRLPESLQALPEIARQQAKLGEAIATSLVQSRQRDQSIESILERIAQGVGQQTDTFGLVQQQLDLNHQASQRIAEAVATLAQGVGDLSSGQRRNSDSLVGLLDRMRDRDETVGKIQGRLHVWLVFSTAVACGSMIACLLLAWAAIRALTST